VLQVLAANVPQKTLVIADLQAAIQKARELAGPEDLILVTGSLFTIGEAREYLAAGAKGLASEAEIGLT
jgi:dihydrofolate synthase/folylpolyglutamate synthase